MFNTDVSPFGLLQCIQTGITAILGPSIAVIPVSSNLYIYIYIYLYIYIYIYIYSLNLVQDFKSKSSFIATALFRMVK